EGQGFLMNVGAIDQHLANILAQVVAHGANDDVGFTVDQEGSRALAGLLGNRLPDLDQVVEVPLQLFSAATDAGSAYDDAHFLRHGKLAHGFLELVALFALDTPGNTTSARVVGHHDKKAPGQADEGGQRGTLVAALFLGNLDNDFLAFLEDFLDAGTTRSVFRKVIA